MAFFPLIDSMAKTLINLTGRSSFVHQQSATGRLTLRLRLWLLQRAATAAAHATLVVVVVNNKID